MTHFKKISMFLFTLALFLVFQNPAEAAPEKKIKNFNGINMTQTEYETLKDIGFTELAIQQMTKEEFEANKNFKYIDKAEKTQYFEVKEVPQIKTFSLSENNSETEHVSTELTEEEYFKRVAAQKNAEEGEFSTLASSDTTATSYRRLKTSIYRISTSTARLTSTFIWDVMPATRSYDILATNIDSTFTPVAGTNFGKQLWSYTHPTFGGFYGDGATYSSSSSTWSKQSAGYGVKMNLKDNASNLRVTELEGYAYYNITRANSVIPRYINAFGLYSHAKTTVSASFSYGLDFGGPGISYTGESSTSFDKISTHAQISY